MKRIAVLVGFGAAGLLLALAMTLGALALAGSDIGEPVTAVELSAEDEPQTSGHASEGPTPERSPRPTATVTGQAGEDHDGSGNPGPSSEDSGGEPSDDNGSRSGEGAHEDSSGPRSGDD